MKKIKYIVLVLLLFVCLGCGNTEEAKSEISTDASSDYSLDEAFSFRNFEVTVGSDISVVTINKELSADNNKKVLRVPITVKNTGTSKDHISMFFYKLFDESKTELLSKGSNFDDSLDYAGDLNPGDSYTKYFYIPYESNGKYYIEFNDLAKKNNLIINVNK